ncbi:hypothetical protein jhhlp_002462 [Lomentospora prolificans]|uniref:Uncharacterized protein n=1 Tax=Lomentospora prolificans TaxID=41688 RepID=A0A2N3NE35_9PEZI|nr:hypothetical protein jhhlp_002462 [Lomentospora prolificans]
MYNSLASPRRSNSPQRPSLPSILNQPSSVSPGVDPSASGSPSAAAPKPRYVVSNSGHAANPEDIIATCREMQSHLDKMRSDAERELAELKEKIHQMELAEKRRIAPGWLDSDVRVLEPERKHADAANAASVAEPPAGVSEMATDEGAELDRVFGTLKM